MEIIVLPLNTTPWGEPISWAEWFSLLTLCLAPVVTHIAVAIPTAVYLHKTHPRWHGSIGLYNPTTILWRYFSIADRRFRAREWTSIEMAATNVNFWTAHGWDGSEQMTRRSLPFCTRIPTQPRISFFSITAFKTFIVTAQGIQGLYIVWPWSYSAPSISFGMIFLPFALFGLLRLPAALWLSEDCSYADVDSEDIFTSVIGSSKRENLSPKNPTFLTQTLLDKGLLQDPPITSETHPYPPDSWRGCITRALCLLALLFLLVITFVYFFTGDLAVSLLLIILLYLFFLTVTCGIFCFYFWHSRLSTTTIIPCIDSIFYKIYTAVLFAGMLVLIIVGAIETRKSPCGIYTFYLEDYSNCGGYIISPHIASGFTSLAGTAFQDGGRIVVVEEPGVLQNFNGWCTGTLSKTFTYIQPQNASLLGTDWL